MPVRNRMKKYAKRDLILMVKRQRDAIIVNMLI
jgi:hypothetical protein